MSYSLKLAAEATGTSKPTILRAIQKGKISAEKDANGEWQIDPAELHRVYPVATVHNGPIEGDCNDKQQSTLPYETGPLQIEVAVLRDRLQQLDIERLRERDQLTGQIEDLRQRLGQESEERRRLTAILTDQSRRPDITAAPTPATPPPAQESAPVAPKGLRGLLRRLTG